uniref:SprT-like family protein n=1 Tax=Marseillevirus LCMAC101 TaxID=2506602 RepID=A0A481YS08_9VIRU|nr:MAG: SprT-like family protein [Marseillevirus LCMAC101]
MGRWSASDKMFTEKEIKRKRERIRRKMLKSGTTPDLKGSNPNLRRLFELYDRYFFKGQIQNKLDKTNSTLDFTFSKHTRTGGTCSKKECSYKINIPIALFRGLFQKGEKTLSINGLLCMSNLECLQITFEHELIHLLMYIYDYSSKKPEYSQSADTFAAHGKLFQCMVFLYFGHTDTKHNLLRGEAADKIKKEDAHVGMRVKYMTKDGTEYHGQILKINPTRARMRQDDGRLMNVPYTMLERSDIKDPEPTKLKKLRDDFHKKDEPLPTKDQFRKGMRITYLHKGEDHYGRITRMNPKRATVELDNGKDQLVPYHMLKETDKKSSKVPQPKKKNIKDDLRVGDWVKIKWRDGETKDGKIKKKNPSRAIISMEDGKNYHVYYDSIVSKTSPKKNS